MMNVLLLGATGLTGGLVMRELLASPKVDRVVALTRRQVELEHPKLESHRVEFESIDAKDSLFRVDIVISCLGTTIRQAGSRSQFRKVDYDYVMQAARLAKKQGASAFLLMSAMGASSRSLVFYNRVKGQLEEGLEALAFPHLSIYQPGLLLDTRREARPLESFGIAVMNRINPLLMGRFRAFRGIEPSIIARAMVHDIATLAEAGSVDKPVTQRLQYDAICELARHQRHA